MRKEKQADSNGETVILPDSCNKTRQKQVTYNNKLRQLIMQMTCFRKEAGRLRYIFPYQMMLKNVVKIC